MCSYFFCNASIFMNLFYRFWLLCNILYWRANLFIYIYFYYRRPVFCLSYFARNKHIIKLLLVSSLNSRKGFWQIWQIFKRDSGNWRSRIPPPPLFGQFGQNVPESVDLKKLTIFLFKSKLFFLQMCVSAHLLSHYYYYYNFCSYLLLLFSTCCFLLLFLIFIVL